MSRPAVPPDEVVVLFSYGTLQQPEVQLETVGRHLDGWADRVVGYRLEWITVTDPEVVRLSGTDRHPALVPDPGGSVAGTAWRLTDRDLAATDAYEVDDYARIRVDLASDEVAWVYSVDPTTVTPG